VAVEASSPLWERALALQEAQLREWPALARGHEFLRKALWREWRIQGWTVKAQCNEGRRASNKARVDPASVEKRPCFLCAENRPPEQRGLDWKGGWWILANPAPLFPHHFTVTSARHGREPVTRRLGDFLDLARDLSPALSVFYNGPRSGASAPDHFHFQAYTAGSLPVEEEVLLGGGPRRGVLARLEEGEVRREVVEAAGRGMLVLTGPDREALLERLRRAVDLLPRPAGAAAAGEGWDEPDLNLLGLFREGLWRIALFPRKAHRPACYFREEPERLLVSPGGADLGGMLVLVRREDLERLEEETILGIYREVAWRGEEILERLGPGGGAARREN